MDLRANEKSYLGSQEYVGTVESVTDEMLLLDPKLTPLIDLIGYDEETTSTTHSWYEDAMFADEFAVASIRDYDLGTEEIPNESVVPKELVTRFSEINIGPAEGVRVDDVMQFDGEQVLVRAISTDSNTGDVTITVDRGHAGTEMAEIAQGSVLKHLFGLVGQEGQDARESRQRQRVRYFNHTQIFDETIEVTGTAQAVSQHGITDLYEYEKLKKQKELALHLEKALIQGIRYETVQESGSDTKITRMLGGLRQYCNTRNKSEMTLEDYIDVAQDLFEMGALSPSQNNYVIMMGMDQKRIVDKIDSDKVVLDPASTKRGQVVNAIVTDFGTFPIMVNDNCPRDEIYIIDPKKLSVRPLKGRSWSHQLLGKTGDRTAGIVFGEYTLEVRQPETMIRIKGLSHR